MLYTSTGALRSQERGQRPSPVGKIFISLVSPPLLFQAVKRGVALPRPKPLEILDRHPPRPIGFQWARGGENRLGKGDVYLKFPGT